MYMKDAATERSEKLVFRLEETACGPPQSRRR